MKKLRTTARVVPTDCMKISNIISAVNHHISATIQRRQQAAALPRRRLHRIVRNSLWLSLTHCAIPPFPQKSRSARLFGCKRPHDGSLSLPTFADCGQGQALSLRYDIIFHSMRSSNYSLRTLHSATVLPPFCRAGLLFECRTEFDVAAAFHTDARNQMLAGLAKFNA